LIVIAGKSDHDPLECMSTIDRNAERARCHALGYATPSDFTAVFQQAFGSAPNGPSKRS
jgi:AraC-like DNA-binding protein